MTSVETDTVRIERTYDAPPEAVFDAWTNPEVLRRWWKTSESDVVEATDVDLRVGGRYRLSMRSADGEEHTVAGEYREVERPRRLVYSWAWQGTGPTAGHESLVAVSFNGDESGARTTVVIEQSSFMNEASRERHGHGWNAVLDSLAREVFAA
jgi:uncharacterized protein YndB with AHSA1/START domain